MSLTAPHFHDAEIAREFLESKVWPSGPLCPHCGVIDNVYKLESKPESRNQLRDGVYKCGGCRKQFTVTVGTIFEDSHIPLHKWLLAIYLMCSGLMCSGLTGISALQLQRELWGKDEGKKDKKGRPKIKGSYRTAWFMIQRIRWAMTQMPVAPRAAND